MKRKSILYGGSGIVVQDGLIIDGENIPFLISYDKEDILVQVAMQDLIESGIKSVIIPENGTLLTKGAKKEIIFSLCNIDRFIPYTVSIDADIGSVETENVSEDEKRIGPFRHNRNLILMTSVGHKTVIPVHMVNNNILLTIEDLDKIGVERINTIACNMEISDTKVYVIVEGKSENAEEYLSKLTMIN